MNLSIGLSVDIDTLGELTGFPGYNILFSEARSIKNTASPRPSSAAFDPVTLPAAPAGSVLVITGFAMMENVGQKPTGMVFGTETMTQAAVQGASQDEAHGGTAVVFYLVDPPTGVPLVPQINADGPVWAGAVNVFLVDGIDDASPFDGFDGAFSGSHNGQDVRGASVTPTGLNRLMFVGGAFQGGDYFDGDELNGEGAYIGPGTTVASGRTGTSATTDMSYVFGFHVHEPNTPYNPYIVFGLDPTLDNFDGRSGFVAAFKPRIPPPAIPASAILDENGEPILDESGDYILDES